MLAEQWLDTIVVECEVDEGLEQLDEVLAFLWRKAILA